MNKKIISANVTVSKKFTMKKMIDIYQSAKEFNGTVYLLNEQKAVDSSNLSRVVSFLLMVKPNSKLKIIVEGTDVQYQLDKMEALCTTQVADLKITKERAIHQYQTIQI
ncbi:HPr family phosphocarrier protein [Cytobacillus purgationiresistens]|uniref:Phosphotransferase system HPr-like phosphotransfer protein n=1 Tax=Cytobacillus purgationiresistens TaxID=863449 RepID=A0ABU0AD61_9BACI|nr:HPr family phosphocarrier protein [Cytobacillus purgationiresistens]MDQ0268980.1 phosphotransferase system HPr-like phosphotransfer protein [Cytobacillus purgationiresistens]